jgi:exodeoxyribonuclease V alpha subunit
MSLQEASSAVLAREKQMTSSVQAVLAQLVDEGKLRAIDMQFAKLMISLESPKTDSEHWLLGMVAAIASFEVGQGNICLKLPSEEPLFTWVQQRLNLNVEQRNRLSDLLNIAESWPSSLLNFKVVGDSSVSAALPLILDEQHLYLQRYWHYEQALATKLHEMSNRSLIENDQLSTTSESLGRLFYRDYTHLFQLWTQHSQSAAQDQQSIKLWLCTALDITHADAIDWATVTSRLHDVQSATELTILDDLIPDSHCLNWQKVAAAVALSKQFSIISGGPGTGKTTTVVKLLAAVIEQSTLSNDEDAAMVIKLVAPTGKAAARLTESIGGALHKLPLAPDIKAVIPTEASTIHRLLGAIPNQPEFRHNRHNPLHLDLLVVDEASMVDLAMMVKLVDALPKHARLILLGDKDQLSSVEAGAVLGDLFSFHQQGYSAKQQATLTKLTGFTDITKDDAVGAITDNLCLLRKSYRFDAHSGIGQLAAAVNRGSVADYNSIQDANFTDIGRYSLTGEYYAKLFIELASHYSEYLAEQRSLESGQTLSETDMLGLAKNKLHQFQKTRLLCAVREGEFGVTHCNRLIERQLSQKRLIQTTEQWYVGRPIMVAQNDHNLGLYNGDIGLCLVDQTNDQGRLKVYFELPDGSIKAVLPSRVPAHETAFAMTIHKSQGSEFDTTYMLLPQTYTPLLSRELVYTGITRAKKSLRLFANKDVMERAISSPTKRASGLARTLEKLALSAS